MEFAGLDKLSLVDFDGHISCILFTRGCNFACPFCHNGPLVIPGVDNQFIPFEEILSFLKKRQGVLDAVVISGGEPTLMPDLKEKIEAIKDLGYLIKLDSNGTRPEVIKDLVESHLIDYIAMDVKSSLETYPLITNARVNTDKIVESINYIKSCGIDYEFRTTLIDEFHDEEDIRQMAELVGNAKRFRLQKYIDREGCISHGFHEVPLEVAKKYMEILKSHIDDVALRSYE
ncbi:MAG: anaerobic ribonucleoside-triphosphate reductase activating protein [Erysipelotrichaceae bacterium]|nr:anaerobic ribonucleoside-triphosphate reductase activating protein [Erysipelotrichaceae bacterium]